jgi:hypothetical protein
MTDVGTDEQSKAVAKTYEPKPQELALVKAYVAAREAKPQRPPIVVGKSGNKVTLQPDFPDLAVAHVLLAKAMGTTDGAFLNELLAQVANASGKGPVPNAEALNFMLAVIEGVGPRDQLEAMLAAQMAAVHTATMTFARRLNHVDNIPQQDSAVGALNKLARTFAVQMETLKRYRTGGEQRVTVQHVTVNDGGQAIVGAVAPTPGGVGHPRNAAPTP